MSKNDSTKNACRQYPTAWWYPNDSKRNNPNTLRALQICGTCENREQCLMHALRNETHGIWGGMREADRELERRRRNIELSPQALASISSTTARAVRRLNKEVTV